MRREGQGEEDEMWRGRGGHEGDRLAKKIHGGGGLGSVHLAQQPEPRHSRV